MPLVDRIRLRRGTAAEWTSANPTLALGEPGVETDTRKTKYGDGSTPWASLPYAASDGLAAYTHTQAAAAATWTINHNLGRKVAVTLYTTGGVQMLADVTHTTSNQAVVNFTSAVAGTALVE
jgi:hypothetical protein